ncbi:MAG: Crp/Fnr family transcriptional regulator [Oscillospiraceae bacterium]
MFSKYLSVLNSVSLFDTIKETELKSILKCLHSEIKLYQKGDYIFMIDDMISTIGIVLSGQVQIIKEDILGNRTILTELVKGEIFGETFVCAGITKSPVSVFCVTNCEIMFIDYNRIVTSCTSACAFHATLIANMLKLIAVKSIYLNQKMTILSKRSIREKLMTYFIIETSKSKSSHFTISFSRNELADYLCIDRSALSRELSKMQKEGLLKFRKNSFELLLSTDL